LSQLEALQASSPSAGAAEQCCLLLEKLVNVDAHCAAIAAAGTPIAAHDDFPAVVAAGSRPR